MRIENNIILWDVLKQQAVIMTSQETDSYDWAVDKLAEAEFNCVEAVVQSVNLTDSTGNNTSSTAARAALVTSQVAQATASVCPLQCNMQGQCINGTCDCDEGTRRHARSANTYMYMYMYTAICVRCAKKHYISC